MRQSWDAMRTFTSFALLSSGKTDLPFVWIQSHVIPIACRSNLVNLSDTK
jgi:hypothetical protein